MPAIELPPFTEAHREAVRACRFTSPLAGRARAIAFTCDVEVVRVLVPAAGMTEAERLKSGAAEHPAVATATHYRRSANPDVYEWELTFSHPDAVAFICDLADGAREKAASRG